MKTTTSPHWSSDLNRAVVAQQSGMVDALAQASDADTRLRNAVATNGEAFVGSIVAELTRVSAEFTAAPLVVRGNGRPVVSLSTGDLSGREVRFSAAIHAGQHTPSVEVAIRGTATGSGTRVLPVALDGAGRLGLQVGGVWHDVVEGVRHCVAPWLSALALS